MTNDLMAELEEMAKRPDLYVAELDVVALLAEFKRLKAANERNDRLLRRARPYCVDSERLYDDICAALEKEQPNGK